MNALPLSTQLAAIKLQLATLFDDCGGETAIELLDALSQLHEDDQRAALEVFLGATERIAEKSRELQRSGKGRSNHNKSENEYERIASALCEEIIDSLGLRRDVEACLPESELDDRGLGIGHHSQNKRIGMSGRESNSNFKKTNEKRRAIRRASFSEKTAPDRLSTAVKSRRTNNQPEGVRISAADTTDATGLECSNQKTDTPRDGEETTRAAKHKKGGRQAQIYVLPRTSV